MLNKRLESRVSRRRFVELTLGTAALPLLAACSAQPAATPAAQPTSAPAAQPTKAPAVQPTAAPTAAAAAKPTTAPAAQPTAAATATAAAKPTSAPVAQQPLKVAVLDFGNEVMDPAETDTTFNEVMIPMFENPLWLDDTGRVGPGVVDKYEVSKDGTAWTLRLRDGVVFHDGTKVTSEDLAFAFRRAVDDYVNEVKAWVDMLGKQPKIDIVDPRTIVVHTQGPQVLFLPFCTDYGAAIWLVPKAHMEKNGRDAFKKNPIGTGPYQFVNHVSGDRIEMKAVNYRHWRVATPQFSPVTVYQVPAEATAVSMLQAKQLDVVQVSPENAKSLKQAGFTIWKGVEAMNYVPIVGAEHELNKGKPLSDVRVRRAMSLAVNRQEIISTMFPDSGSMSGPIRVGYNMPDMTDALRTKWKEWTTQNFRYDVAEAKKLLGEAGHPNGFTFDFLSVPDTGSPYLADLVQILAGYWEKVGIKARIVKMDGGAWRKARSTQVSQDGIGKMGIQNSSMDKPSAAENVGSVFASNKSMDALVGHREQERMNTLFKQAMSTLDPAAAEKILDQMIEIATASWIQIPIVNVSMLYALSPRVAPVLPRPTLYTGNYYGAWKYTGK